MTEARRPKPRGPGRPPNPLSRNQQMSKSDPRYQPTKAELEEVVTLDATFEELMDAMFGPAPAASRAALNRMERDMSWGDRLTVLAAAGTIAATVGVGTCSTNGRIDGLDNRVTILGERVGNLAERVATVEGKLDVLIAQSGSPSDD